MSETSVHGRGIRDVLLRNFRAMKGRAYPRIIGMNREPSWLFFDTLMPILSIAAFVYIYKAMNAPPQYIGYVIIGGAMTAYWMNVLWAMAAQLYWEKEIGNLQLYTIAPVSTMSVMAGMAVGGAFSTTIRAVSTILVGIIIFNVKFSMASPLLLTAIFVFTMIALYGMGMMFASLYMLWGREAWHISEVLTEPVYLLSGFYFPVKYLGTGIATIAALIPLTLGLDGMRQLLFPYAGDGFIPAVYELSILVILSVAFLFLARYFLNYMETLAKKEGRLTLRWQ